MLHINIAIVYYYYDRVLRVKLANYIVNFKKNIRRNINLKQLIVN